MFFISAFVRHFWLLWKERNQVFLAFLGVRLGIFLSIVVRFILRGCIFSWFRSLFSVSSSRSPPPPYTHPPFPLTHTWACVCVMCTILAAFPHGHMCAPEGHMCECVHARARRGLDVTPAAAMNRVSGRVLQQAAAACCHYKPNSLSESKPPGLPVKSWPNTRCPLPSSAIITAITFKHCSPPFPSQGQDLWGWEGNLKLNLDFMKGKDQKQPSVGTLCTFCRW